MKGRHLRFREGFRVIPGNRHSQAAEMVIAPGDSEGGADNRHRGADQWLYVLSGSGTALVKTKRYRLAAVYVPPAYGRNGDPLPRGRK
jgi:mannose-6-phosphate isomerase-like protein (cupin superfamily)